MSLPVPGFEITRDTALLVIDPQNDFLSPEGVAWGVVGASVTEHNVVDNIEKLFADSDKTKRYLQFLKMCLLKELNQAVAAFR